MSAIIVTHRESDKSLVRRRWVEPLNLHGLYHEVPLLVLRPPLALPGPHQLAVEQHRLARFQLCGSGNDLTPSLDVEVGGPDLLVIASLFRRKGEAGMRGGSRRRGPYPIQANTPCQRDAIEKQADRWGTVYSCWHGAASFSTRASKACHTESGVRGPYSCNWRASIPHR